MSSIEDRAKEILKEDIKFLVELQDRTIRIGEQIGDLENEQNKIEESKTETIERMAKKLEASGMEPDKICSTIKRILKQNYVEISDSTVERACGISKKRKYERYPDEKSIMMDFQQPVTVSTSGSQSVTGSNGEEREREEELPINEELERIREAIPTKEEVLETSAEIALSVIDELKNELKDRDIRLNETFALVKDKDSEIERQQLQIGELEIRLSDLEKKNSKVSVKNVDQIEDLRIQLDEAKIRIQELEELERLRVQKEDFKPASKVQSGPSVWVAAINALNLYRGLNEASKYAIEHNDPWKKVIFDVGDGGQLKNARLEA